MLLRCRPFSLANWERKNTFLNFRDYPMPYLVIGANLEIGSAYTRLKEAGASPFLWTVHCASRAANENLPFRLRIREGDLVEHERVHPSFTVPDGEEAFGLRRAPFVEDFGEFQSLAQAAPRLNFSPQSDQIGEDHWIFLSCMPWIHFSHVVQPVSPDTASIPRVIWGKLRDGRLPISVQVHHGLMDGLHVGRFLSRLEELLSDDKSLE